MVGAPSSPVTGSPVRRPGSIRRTSHIDMDLSPGGVDLRGAARDLATRADGAAAEIATATVEADVGPDRTLRAIRATPPTGEVDSLSGLRMGSGFRTAIAGLLVELRGTPLALLLDDLPVAALISGYIMFRTGRNDAIDPAVAGPAVVARMADMCSGWTASGHAVAEMSAGRRLPVQASPPAPPLDADDVLSWHVQPPLPPGVMRRRRRIDVWREGSVVVDAMFRDTFAEPDGAESVLHEYTLSASLDADTLVIDHIEAVPRVLPFGECPAAAANIARLAGMRVNELRTAVPGLLGGTAGCTHLNDLLRALNDVGFLAAAETGLAGG